jgi:predicted nucleotidyltransferase
LNTPTSANIDDLTQQVANSFLSRVKLAFNVKIAILFGSRARQTHRPDSDLDLAIILRGEQRDFLDTKLEMADIAYDILLDTGIRVQALPVWEHQWIDPEHFSNPHLLRRVATEGVSFG